MFSTTQTNRQLKYDVTCAWSKENPINGAVINGAIWCRSYPYPCSPYLAASCIKDSWSDCFRWKLNMAVAGEWKRTRFLASIAFHCGRLICLLLSFHSSMEWFEVDEKDRLLHSVTHSSPFGLLESDDTLFEHLSFVYFPKLPASQREYHMTEGVRNEMKHDTGSTCCLFRLPSACILKVRFCVVFVLRFFVVNNFPKTIFHHLWRRILEIL